MVTIKEIAKRCGVSTATVSKVLNGYTDIGPETSRKVLEAAKEMNYYPNSSALALKTKRTNNLGVLFIDKTQSGLSHEYFSSILESFKVKAEEMGYDITFISRNIGGNQMSYLEHCRYRNCDGIVIASVDFEDPEIVELINGEIPIVTIDHVFNNRTAVLSDNVQDMRELTRYIIDCGHRDIAFIHGENTHVTRKRLAGFYLACQEAGLNIPDAYVRESRYHDSEGSMMATRELLSLSPIPTCIMYPDDFSSIGGINEIRASGLRIPDDISVTGYDGIYLSQAMHPKLATLQQNAKKQGMTAAVKLIEAIENPKTSFPEQIIVKGLLLTGETVKNINRT